MIVASESVTLRTDGERHVLACQCGDCRLPAAYIQNGVLVIHSEHYGKKHVNVLTLADLDRLLHETLLSH